MVGSVLRQQVGHNTGGFPNFDGWPGWRDYTHQQVYVDWLRRAYDGGLRLMVMTAVNNSAGTWEIRFRIAGDPTEHGAGFQIR